MDHNQELPVILKCYEFTRWLYTKIKDFPRDLRFSLGQRIESLMLDILELLIEAKFSKDKQRILNQVNTKIEVLRFQLRLAKDLKAFSEKTFWSAIEQLIEIGQQVGGWLRTSHSRSEQ